MISESPKELAIKFMNELRSESGLTRIRPLLRPYCTLLTEGHRGSFDFPYSHKVDQLAIAYRKAQATYRVWAEDYPTCHLLSQTLPLVDLSPAHIEARDKIYTHDRGNLLYPPTYVGSGVIRPVISTMRHVFLSGQQEPNEDNCQMYAQVPAKHCLDSVYPPTCTPEPVPIVPVNLVPDLILREFGLANTLPDDESAVVLGSPEWSRTPLIFAPEYVVYHFTDTVPTESPPQHPIVIALEARLVDPTFLTFRMTYTTVVELVERGGSAVIRLPLTSAPRVLQLMDSLTRAFSWVRIVHPALANQSEDSLYLLCSDKVAKLDWSPGSLASRMWLKNIVDHHVHLAFLWTVQQMTYCRYLSTVPHYHPKTTINVPEYYVGLVPRAIYRTYPATRSPRPANPWYINNFDVEWGMQVDLREYRGYPGLDAHAVEVLAYAWDTLLQRNYYGFWASWERIIRVCGLRYRVYHHLVQPAPGSNRQLWDDFFVSDYPLGDETE